MACRRNWECENCQGINGEHNAKCDVCGKDRNGGGRYQHRKQPSSRQREGCVKYDWDSVCSRETPGRNGPREQDAQAAVGMWKCTQCTYYNAASSQKCKMCHRGVRSNEKMTGPPGPTRDDRNGYPRSKMPSSSADRNDVTSRYDRPPTRGSGYNKPRVPRDDRNSPGGRPHSSVSGTRREPRKPIYEDCVDKNERRLVLLGKTGCGKSATGNNILSGDYFRSMVSGSSVTKSCRRGVVQRNGKEIHVVDTPGLFDTEIDNDVTTQEIAKCIGITAPGPHAFLLVLRIGRFTPEERDSVEHFIQHFGRSVERYMIVLFTGMDNLHDEGMTLDDHLRRIPSSLASILQRCGGRCVGFNNKGTAREVSRQVDQLMEMVEDLFEQNNGRYYTNTLYMEAENVVRTREAEIRSMEEEKRRRELEEFEDEHNSYYRRELKKREERQQEIERRLKEAESRTGQEDRKRRIRTEEINRDIRSIRDKIEHEQRAGRSVSSHLQNRLSDLERERNRIVSMEGNVSKMQAEVTSLRGQLHDMKKEMSRSRQKQNDEREKRIKALEQKYADSEKKTREVVRKEVEKGETNIGDQLISTVVGLGKMIWKGLSKLF